MGRTARIAACLVLLGVFSHAGSLRWGFLYDDYFHQFALRGLGQRTTMPWWGLYEFTAGDRLQMPDWRTHPWWASPDFKVRFFRPVTSLTLWADYRLWEDWAPGYHLTSLACFAAFLWLAFRLYIALGVPARASLWALAFLAVKDGHTLLVSWIASRNGLLGAVFVVATVLAAVRSTTSRHPRRWLLIGVGCFLLACGSRESGIMAAPLVGLYLLTLGPCATGRPMIRRIGPCLRSPALWILGVLAFGFLTFYVLRDYGTRSLMYPMPWRDPGAYLARFAVFIPVSLLSLFLGVASDVVPAFPQYTPWLICAGVPLLAGVGYILFRLLGWTRIVVFAVGWIFLSFLAVGGTEPSDRLLMDASVASCLLIGMAFDRLLPLKQQWASRQYAQFILAVFLLLGLVSSVPMTIARSVMIARVAHTDRSIIRDAEIEAAVPAPRHVFLLNSPSNMLSLTMATTWAVIHHDRQTEFFPLQFGRRGLTWKRIDEHTMTLTATGPPFLENRFERLFISPGVTLVEGAHYRTSAFTAVAEDVEGDGIRTVRFVFDRRIDDPANQFLSWHAGRLTRTEPPAIGARVELLEVPRLHRLSP
ncbi:MAG: hypothetical protein KA354_06085 [Phycisphaerae bacterium]|nr:hypothetical protein [Phycisphaerae bacterium]